MPNIKSAKKRMELSRAARSKNRAERSRAAGSADDARARLLEAQAVLDRAANRRLIHPNAVARLKGQLQRHVNALTA